MFCIHCHFEFPLSGDAVGTEVNCPNCSLKVSVPERNVTCFCSECEGRIIVPLTMIGGKGTCPHCKKETKCSLGDEAYRFFSEIADRESQFSKSTLRPGGTIGKYKIIRCLGIGGMGEVYLVEHTLLNSHFALKVLRKEVVKADPELQTRLLREARLAGNIHHPNLISVVDVELDSSTNFAYIVMEYVNGVSIEQLLDVGAISELRTLEIIRDAGLALKAASEHHIIHRDIKPANIMLASDGTVKLADLGVAKVSGKGDGAPLTLDNAILGTPNYASPEQLRSSNAVDSRADIYSLGVTMHHMLTGVRPFDADSVYGVMANVLDEPLPPLQSFDSKLSKRLSRLIDKMCAKDPDERPEDMDAMIALIEQEIAVLKSGGDKKKFPVALVAGGVALLVVIIGIVIALAGGKGKKEQTSAVPEPAPVVEKTSSLPKLKPIKLPDDGDTDDSGSVKVMPEKATVRVFKAAKKPVIPEVTLDELIQQLRESDGSVRVELARVPEMLKDMASRDKEKLNFCTMEYFNLRCRNLLGAEKYPELHQLFQDCAWLEDPKFFELRDSLPGHLLEVFVRAVNSENNRLALDTGKLYISLVTDVTSGAALRMYLDFEDNFNRCNFGACRKIAESMPNEEAITGKLRERIQKVTEFEIRRLKSDIYAAFDREDYAAMKVLLQEYEELKPDSSFVDYFSRKVERHKETGTPLRRNRIQLMFNEAMVAGDIRVIRIGLENKADLHRVVFGWDGESKVSLLMKTLQKASKLPAGYSRLRIIGGIIAVLDSEPEVTEQEFDMLCSIPELKDYL